MFKPALSFVLLPLVASGCHFTEAKFNNGLGFSGERVLLVPFRESRKRLWYGESRQGHDIVAAVEAWAMSRDIDAQFLKGELAEETLHQVTEWPNERMTVADWKRIVAPRGARYVLEGDVLHFALERPKIHGYYLPVAILDYRVIDLDRGEVVWERKNWRIETADGDGREEFRLQGSFEDPRAVEHRFLAEIGKRLGGELYGYYE